MKALAFVYRMLRGLALAVVGLCIGVILVCATVMLAVLGATAGSAVIGIIILIIIACAVTETWDWFRQRYP